MKPRGLATLLTVSLAALVISGCATSQAPVELYTLPDVPISESDVAASADHQLVIRPVRLASYLEVEGIVFQVDDLTVRAAQGHQWAEPLGSQLERGLRDRLAARLGDTRVMLDSDTSRQETPLALKVEMTRFQGRHDGEAIAEGRWMLRDPQGELLALTPFRLTTTLKADGYPALVKALGDDLDRLADRLATDIRRLR
ncbi:ABC-type transport auxiliary lipoprotein family protein [Halomonas sp. 18H]|uniref:PqiC family protein n=1 Tax=Halomonas almeriensis TaxID=308163 RepID=UPI00222EA818|nr:MULTISPECIES: ABC-type transport auxiliary lipoprotein family protein [Halomonas]MCW4151769.1 ABC-type transport auxiliary lipoprotein family protein [Halomonas sp. 18H]MDN3554015.1 ABC-type transport auxiliary lipoprotein family protein [Halomonas almeriensis]